MEEIVLEMFEFIFCGGLFDDALTIFTTNPSDPASDWYGAWSLVNSIYNTYVIPIGLGIMIIWFLVAFMEKAASEQMNFDQIFSLCVKLVVSFYLIQHGMEIFAKLWGLGISLVNELSDGLKEATISDMYLDDAWEDISGGEDWNDGDPDLPGFWRSIGAFAQLLFPWLVAGLMSACATFIAYSRMLEMLLRVAVAPIALSDFFRDGLHSNAWRYMKTFLAICLQGFCILLICHLYSVGISSPIGRPSEVIQGVTSSPSFMDVVVRYFVVSFSALALMFKSLSFCKELIGAQ